MIVLLVINAVVGAMQVCMTPLGWGLSFLFVAGTTAATILFPMGVELCGPQYTLVLSTFEPQTSAVAGVILLHEKMVLCAALSVACVKNTVVLLARKKNERREQCNE